MGQRRKVKTSGSRRGHRPEAGEGAVRAEVGRLRARHMELGEARIVTEEGVARVAVNESESPLAWLARRKGRDGRSLISGAQFLAGERLRADFTRASMTPRMTARWDAAPRGNGGGGGEITDVILAARQRMRQALDACGPEFSGLLMDVCCFLRGLEDVERERGWPSRSAKVVLQLGLDRLARHYGFSPPERGRLRSWSADGG